MATKVKDSIKTAPEEVLTAGEVEMGVEQSPADDTIDEAKTGEVKSRMYLMSALAKDAASALGELTALVASAGSKVEKAEDLGLKKLAFPINKHRELSLVSVFFNATSQTIRTLDGELKHAETIERYLLSTWRAGLDEPKRRSSTLRGAQSHPESGRGTTLRGAQSHPESGRGTTGFGVNQADRLKREEKKNV